MGVTLPLAFGRNRPERPRGLGLTGLPRRIADFFVSGENQHVRLAGQELHEVGRLGADVRMDQKTGPITAGLARIPQPVRGAAGPADLDRIGQASAVHIARVGNEGVGITLFVVGVGGTELGPFGEARPGPPQRPDDQVRLTILVNVGGGDTLGVESGVDDLLLESNRRRRRGGLCQQGPDGTGEAGNYDAAREGVKHRDNPRQTWGDAQEEEQESPNYPRAESPTRMAATIFCSKTSRQFQDPRHR